MNPTQPAPVPLRYFLDERGVLAGAHTVSEDAPVHLALQLASDEPRLRLTANESHGLLTTWHALLSGPDGLPADGLDLVLPADSSRLEVTFAAPVAASTLDWVELDDDAQVVVATHRLTPPAPREEMVDPWASTALNLGNALRERAALPPVASAAFAVTETFGVATPLVDAVLASVPAMGVPQIVASHFIWTGIMEQGFRPDISFNTLEALAARAGRSASMVAGFEAASDLAVELLGAQGPSPLLQEATSLVATATDVPEDAVLALTAVVAEHFFRHLQVVVASAVMYDVAAAEDIQPPLRAWLMALEGPGEDAGAEFGDTPGH